MNITRRYFLKTIAGIIATTTIPITTFSSTRKSNVVEGESAIKLANEDRPWYMNGKYHRQLY